MLLSWEWFKKNLFWTLLNIPDKINFLVSNPNKSKLDNNLDEMSTYIKVLYILTPTWISDCWKEYTKICFMILERVLKMNLNQNKNISRQSTSKKLIVGLNMENKEETKNSHADSPILGANDKENSKYFTIENYSDNDTPEEFNRLRAKVLGSILHRLTIVNSQINSSVQESVSFNYRFSLFNILEVLVERFKDNFLIDLNTCKYIS